MAPPISDAKRRTLFRTYTFDADLLLHPRSITMLGAAWSAGQNILDLGDAYVEGHMVIQAFGTSTLGGADGIVLGCQLSDDASEAGTGFDAGDNIRDRGFLQLGLSQSAAPVNADDIIAENTTYALPVTNEIEGFVHRYMRLVFLGIASGNLTADVYLAKTHAGTG